MAKQQRFSGMKLKNINLMRTDPNKEQFAPTDRQPIRQRARMGGDPMGSSNEANAASSTEAGMKRPGLKGESDRELHTRAKAGDSAAKEELIKRIAEPVR